MSFSPRGMTCCFLCHRPFRIMLPYTSTSLKRKKTLGCGPRRLCFISRPSPIRTRPGWDKGFPDGPNEFSTAWIRSWLSRENVSWSTMVSSYSSQVNKSPVFRAAVWDFVQIVPRLCRCEMLSWVLSLWAAVIALLLDDAMGLSKVSSALRKHILQLWGRSLISIQRKWQKKFQDVLCWNTFAAWLFMCWFYTSHVYWLYWVYLTVTWDFTRKFVTDYGKFKGSCCHYLQLMGVSTHLCIFIFHHALNHLLSI